ncbi:MAG: hypothetical protein ACYTE0_09425 [Planctomycetota bacterium]
MSHQFEVYKCLEMGSRMRQLKNIVMGLLVTLIIFGSTAMALTPAEIDVDYFWFYCDGFDAGGDRRPCCQHDAG